MFLACAGAYANHLPAAFLARALNHAESLIRARGFSLTVIREERTLAQLFSTSVVLEVQHLAAADCLP